MARTTKKPTKSSSNKNNNNNYVNNSNKNHYFQQQQQNDKNMCNYNWHHHATTKRITRRKVIQQQQQHQYQQQLYQNAESMLKMMMKFREIMKKLLFTALTRELAYKWILFRTLDIIPLITTSHFHTIFSEKIVRLASCPIKVFLRFSFTCNKRALSRFRSYYTNISLTIFHILDKRVVHKCVFFIRIDVN